MASGVSTEKQFEVKFKTFDESESNRNIFGNEYYVVKHILFMRIFWFCCITLNKILCIFRSLKVASSLCSFIQTIIRLLRKEEGILNSRLLQDQSLASLHEVFKAMDFMFGITASWGRVVVFPRDPSFGPRCAHT